jgi:Spy/CpxP family protein refolding chaperone
MKGNRMKLQRTIKLIAVCALLTPASTIFAQHSGHAATPSAQASPYVGEQSREIKSLSAGDVSGLLSGAGMAYAKAAELNGYPGPAHVLELSTQLQLETQQRAATEKLMAEHKAKARAMGAQLVAAERELDLAFAQKQIDALRINELTQRIGALQASLRAEHLQTHLTQTALLSPEQIASYQRLRGYGQAVEHKHSTTH